MILTPTAAKAGDDGLPKPLEHYSGQIVYLDFWASWCGPCAQSFPWLNQMQARYGKQLTIVAVNVDSDSADAKAFLNHHTAHFDVIFDPAGELAEHYRIDGMPNTVILNRSGHPVHRHSGFYDTKEGDYETAIRNVIESPSSPAGNAP